MKYDYSKLKGRIKEKYGTQGEFAKALDLAQTTVSLKVNGKTEWTQNEIEKSIEALGLSKDDIGDYFFNIC